MSAPEDPVSLQSRWLDQQRIARPDAPSLPLDPIDVPALDLQKVNRILPELVPVLDLITSPACFQACWSSISRPSRFNGHSALPSPDSDVDCLLDWGVVSQIARTKVPFTLGLFTVPKSSGKLSRLVVDASPINKLQFRPPRFSLLSLSAMRHRVFSAGVAIKLDLRQCFYQFPLHPDISAFFCCRIPGRGFVCFTRLPMGWSYAPYICQKFAEAMCRLSCEPGADVICLLDDWLFLSGTPGLALLSSLRCRALLSHVGASVNVKKSGVVESHIIEFNGLEWNLADKCHRLAPSFVSKWLNWLKALLTPKVPLPSTSVRVWVTALSVSIYAI